VRRRGRVSLVPLVAAVSAYWLPGAAPLVQPVGAALGLRRRVRGGEGIALTFDDGPHPQGTPAVLESLGELNATATFFLVGEQVERRPELVGEIVARGHEVGVHCYRHRCLLRLSPHATSLDLRRAAAALESVGVEPRLYRPPYGLANLAALVAARRNGWLPLLWSSDGRDWQRRATPTSVAERVLRRGTAGGVVLLHDADHYSAPGSWRATARALPWIVRELRNRGYTVGSYGEIAADTAKSGS
jgi:peptidoglycan/xylan/chitin deacetylase (PgdA/CDA1 family)